MTKSKAQRKFEKHGDKDIHHLKKEYDAAVKKANETHKANEEAKRERGCASLKYTKHSDYKGKPNPKGKVFFRVESEEWFAIEDKAIQEGKTVPAFCKELALGIVRSNLGSYLTEKQPCKKCGKPMTEFIQGRKAIWLCPHCQKKEHLAAMKNKAKNHGKKK